MGFCSDLVDVERVKFDIPLCRFSPIVHEPGRSSIYEKVYILISTVKRTSSISTLFLVDLYCKCKSWTIFNLLKYFSIASSIITSFPANISLCSQIVLAPCGCDYSFQMQLIIKTELIDIFDDHIMLDIFFLFNYNVTRDTP